jgi:hypothetical protein
MLLAVIVFFSAQEFLYEAFLNELLHKEPNNKVLFFISNRYFGWWVKSISNGTHFIIM